jgi:hypothetical protein
VAVQGEPELAQPVDAASRAAIAGHPAVVAFGLALVSYPETRVQLRARLGVI